MGKSFFLFITVLSFFLACENGKVSESEERITKVEDNTEKLKELSVVIDLLNELDEKIILSEKLIKLWVAEQTVSDNQDKQELKKMIEAEIPTIKKTLEEKKKFLTKLQQEKMQSLIGDIDRLFIDYKEVMNSLSSFADYEDPINLFTAESLVDNDSEINAKTKKIGNDIQGLLKEMNRELKKLEK